MKNYSFVLDELIETESFYAPMSLEAAYAWFEKTNINPANSYRSGYERYMSLIPKINGNADPNKQLKLDATAAVIEHLASILLDQYWITENWPAPDKMLTRTILAIDKETGAELVLVRWNKIETPIHGHAPGQMIDYLISGVAGEVEYEVVDAENRLVVQKTDEQFFNPMSVLSNEFNLSESVNRGALIHKFIAKQKSITLHLIPEHPRDGVGNLFTEASAGNCF